MTSSRWYFPLILFLILCAVTPVFADNSSDDPPSLVGRLNFTQGPVSFRSGSLDEWTPAELNYPVTVGDQLWSDAGARAELHVGSTAIRLAESTSVSFLNMDDQTVQISEAQGTMNVRLRRLDPGDVFEIDTPNSVITLLQPGSYTIDVQGDEGSSVAVRAGQAEISATGNDFTVPAGQVANISGSGSIAYYTTPLPPSDDYDAWFLSRDQREDQLTALRYVPREMIGVEDLDDNGTWVVMAGYGPCWAPTRVVSGWAPYKFGRWAWVEPWGWTWIDDEPWGFAPFHYGRWAFLGGRWLWVPGEVVQRPVYAPALVVFVGGSPADPSAGGIGWFPLGPREVYVPPYRASPTYVQRVNVMTIGPLTIQTIETINVTQVTYVNRFAPSAVTVVPRQSFVYGQPTRTNTVVFSTDQARQAPIIGMGATVAPQRESIVGQPFVSRNPAPQPPPQVIGRPVYGRMEPAPARGPFVVNNAPPPPVVGYQPPPQRVAPAPRAPVRQPAPVIVNPYNRPPGMAPQPGPGYQQPPVAQPQPRPFAPQPQQPPVVRPQAGPGYQQPPVAQPQPRPQQPQPQLPVVQPQPRPQQPPATQPQQPGAGQQKPGDKDNQGRGGDQGGDNKGRDNQGRGQAQSLINELKLKTVPDVQRRLDQARKTPGAKLDFASLSARIDSARSAISSAESTLSSGKSDAALQQAQSAQRQLSEIDQLISQGMSGAGGDNRDDNRGDNNRGGDQGKGDRQGDKR